VTARVAVMLTKAQRSLKGAEVGTIATVALSQTESIQAVVAKARREDVEDQDRLSFATVTLSPSPLRIPLACVLVVLGGETEDELTDAEADATAALLDDEDESTEGGAT